MKENVFDVLMFLFENYMDDGSEFNPDQETLTDELSRAGFPHGEITKAFHWLEGLSILHDEEEVLVASGNPLAIRHYSPLEQEKISLECRNFLVHMEYIGVLEPRTREIVIDRIMALDVDEISMDQLRWIILLVLYNQPDQEQAYALLEDMVFDESQVQLH